MFSLALAFQISCVVATRVFGVSAGSIHDYRAAGRAIGWIEMNCRTLKRESSVHGMESGCQCELDPGVRWIEFSHFLRAKAFPRAGQQQKLKVRPITSEALEGVSDSHSCRPVEAIVHSVSAGNDSRRPAWMESARRSWTRE
jgi:hypothetical protein